MCLRTHYTQNLNRVLSGDKIVIDRSDLHLFVMSCVDNVMAIMGDLTANAINRVRVSYCPRMKDRVIQNIKEN